MGGSRLRGTQPGTRRVNTMCFLPLLCAAARNVRGRFAQRSRRSVHILNQSLEQLELEYTGLKYPSKSGKRYSSRWTVLSDGFRAVKCVDDEIGNETKTNKTTFEKSF